MCQRRTDEGQSGGSSPSRGQHDPCRYGRAGLARAQGQHAQGSSTHPWPPGYEIRAGVKPRDRECECSVSLCLGSARIGERCTWDGTSRVNTCVFTRPSRAPPYTHGILTQQTRTHTHKQQGRAGGRAKCVGACGMSHAKSESARGRKHDMCVNVNTCT